MNYGSDIQDAINDNNHRLRKYFNIKESKVIKINKVREVYENISETPENKIEQEKEWEIPAFLRRVKYKS